MTIKHLKNSTLIQSLIVVIIIVGLAYLTYAQASLSKSIKQTQENFDKNNQELTQKITDIETILLATQEQGTTLSEALAVAEEKSASLSKQFDKVNDNVDTLEKITTTDKELLQKYSKVYFLNEHYAPTDLKKIPGEYGYESSRTYQIHEQVYSYLVDMLEDAKADGVDLQVISAFRSFSEQAILKGSYTVTYGAGTANQFSADQGYSEHQLGTTVDFTNDVVGGTFSGFAKSETYAWLTENAYKYGFILSYPDNNQYYEYEPWHWRFVGKRLAKDLHDDGKYFYDLTQREIDEYIVYLFD